MLVDQSPIGRTPRSNPVTYIKAFDPIRELFARTREADKRGYTPGHFSFNIPGGRCETCQGDGTVTVEMQFLADVELICEECNGTRYKQKVLEVEYTRAEHSRSAAADGYRRHSFFADTPRVVQQAAGAGGRGPRLSAAGSIGHDTIGRRSAARQTGGASGALRPRSAICSSSTSRPRDCTFDDIAKLLDAFDRLIKNGASMLIIEHNLEVIRAADWIIDLGPEGGDGGGRIVADGPPDAIAARERFAYRAISAQLVTTLAP